MLLTKKIEVGLSGHNIKYYENKGYEIPRKINKRNKLSLPIGSKIFVNINDLQDNSCMFVDVECDKCKKKLHMTWQNYKTHVRLDGKYYCKICATQLFGTEKMKMTKLKNGKSFEQWCIDNDRQDVLNRWDYELNDCNPNEICYSTMKKYWFKCPRNIHGSELKSICGTAKNNNFIECKQCNSLCQYGIDYIDKNFLSIYWSEKNIKSPYEYTKNSTQKVWWKCPEGIHEDYYRKINNSFTCDFRCPKCQYSKGEFKINKYLTNNNICYESQKIFNNLIGLKGGLLSYDFYLPDYNLLIEYQGEMHEKFVKGIHKSTKDFEKQLEHDRRKKEYAKNNNINLLEIWYWDFDNIEEILDEYLGNINQSTKIIEE